MTTVRTGGVRLLSALAALLAVLLSATTPADGTPPAPVDRYKLSVAIPSYNLVVLQGKPGSLEVGGSARVFIARTGTQVVEPANDDGSFLIETTGQRGDRFDVYSVDSDGNVSTATTVYAGVFRVKNPYQSTGYWHVGQGHFHTAFTDGLNSPGAMEAAYYDAGYDFVISTDHRGIYPFFVQPQHGMTPNPSNFDTGKDLLWIDGDEVSTGASHMNAWGLQDQIGTFDYFGNAVAIPAIRARGALVVMNHPKKLDPPYAWDWYSEVVPAIDVSMVEAFNGNQLLPDDQGAHVDMAIDLADDFRQVWWVGADDSHSLSDPRQFDRYAIVVQTDAAVPNRADILTSADTGRMFITESAAGPKIQSVVVQNNVITLTMADDASNYDVVWKRRGADIWEQDLNIDRIASYTVRGTEGYVRAEVRRISDNKHAYTQPLFVGNNVDLSVSASHAALVDNDAATAWDAGGSTGVFTIDLGRSRMANGIAIEWDNSGGARFNYQIYASTSGLFEGEEQPLTRNTFRNTAAATLDFFDVYARYIRVVVTGQSNGYGGIARVKEVEVFDASPTTNHFFIDNVSGDDAAAGTIASPWRTIAHARKLIRPRDTLHLINTGVPFTESLDLGPEQSGKHPLAKIFITGDEDILTEIDASQLQFGVRFVDSKYVEVSNLDIRGAGIANVWFADAGVGSVIRKSRIHNASGRGVLASGQARVDRSLIYANGSDGIFVQPPDGSTITARGNTIYGNGAAGIALQNLGLLGAVLRNNIVAGNAGDELWHGDTPVTVDMQYNCVYGATSGSGWVGSGTVSGHPLLVSPDYGDLRLNVGSPCIDAGIDLLETTDFDGGLIVDQSSVVNTGAGTRKYVDIGAYEFQGAGNTCSATCHSRR